MQVQFTNAPDFTVDRHNVLRRRGVWLLSCNADEGDIADLAAQWAGNINDPWKKPNADGSGFLPDENIRIAEIKCTALDSRTCQVEFTGIAAGTGVDTSPQSSTFERRRDGSEYRTVQYTVLPENLSQLPASGDLIGWNGNDYRCESLTARELENGSYQVELTAVKTFPPDNNFITSDCGNQHQQQKTGTWLINADELDDFLNGNALHHQAAWAGENFYIANIHTEPANSACRTRVTLTARCAELKLLEKYCTAEIISMAGNTPIALNVWHSRWLATAADQPIFENMLGQPADWTGDEKMITCKVTPRAISECEYEYILEARYAENIVSGSGRWWHDKDLPSRHEFRTRIGEMRLTPQQCGYYWRPSGHYINIYNWNPTLLCPFSANLTLPRTLINKPLRLLEIAEISYLSGPSGENIQAAAGWFNAQRIEDCTLAGISGNFLRYDIDVDDITDSRDRRWTRITQIYRLAPMGYRWNSYYWI